MTADRLQQRADQLAARVEALAQALRASGVAEEAAAQLLSQASTAVLQALTLELVLEQPSATRKVEASLTQRPVQKEGPRAHWSAAA